MLIKMKLSNKIIPNNIILILGKNKLHTHHQIPDLEIQLTPKWFDKLLMPDIVPPTLHIPVALNHAAVRVQTRDCDHVDRQQLWHLKI